MKHKAFSRAITLATMSLIVGLCLSFVPPEASLAQTPSRPNIVLILADDLRYDDLKYVPKTKALVADKGMTFSNAFVTDSICCPSRASILRGQYPHNHGVHTVDRDGAFNAFHNANRQDSTVATWLQGSGYRTALLGKYFNGSDAPDKIDYIPPGWNEWFGTGGYGTKYNDNGTIVTYDPAVENPTDALADHATDYIKRTSGDTKPFFMYVAPKPPHVYSWVADRHKDAYPNARAPRPPSFNESDVSDKPSWIRNKNPFSLDDLARIDERHRHRLQTMLSLDDLVERVVGALQENGQLETATSFSQAITDFASASIV